MAAVSCISRPSRQCCYRLKNAPNVCTLSCIHRCTPRERGLSVSKMSRFEERVVAESGMLTTFELMKLPACPCVSLGSPVKSGFWACRALNRSPVNSPGHARGAAVVRVIPRIETTNRRPRIRKGRIRTSNILLSPMQSVPKASYAISTLHSLRSQARK